MDVKDYTKQVRHFSRYDGLGTEKGVIYNVLKIAGEAGELADLAGKGMALNVTLEQIADKKGESLADECGDLLFHLVALMLELGLTPEQIMERNVDKLSGREAEGKLLFRGTGKN